MDYSVGSLADLITGSNTPNKPKVVQKAFKKEKRSPDSSFEKRNSKIKKIKKEINLDQNASEYWHIDKRGSKLQKTKKESPNNSYIKIKKERKVKNKNIGSDQDAELQLIKKNKVKKLNENENNSSSAKYTTKKSGKKRKLETVSNFSVSDEGSPPKKEKTDFQQNAERRVKKKVNEEKKVTDPEELARTIFVGNVPINIDKIKIERYFKKYGPIKSVRIRGIPVADPKTSKKIAAIKKEFNPNRSNVYCYIKFEKKEDALKAEVENGALFEGHHLRVHSCESNEKPDETKAIFVGNLSFDALEDELWSLFGECGPISHVRIIRDSRTGMGKGFAYVNFKDSDAVQLALEMENVKLKDRELRISLCNLNAARKNKKFNKKKEITKSGKQKFRKNFNKNPDQETPGKQKGKTIEANTKSGKQKFRKNFNKNPDQETPGKQKGKTIEANTEYQGTKFSDKKKKHKMNKGLLQKKKLVKKIAPRVK